MILAQLNQRQLGIRVKFRKTDYFRGLEESLNLVIDRWKGDLISISEAHQRAASLLNELQNHPNSPEKIKELEQALAKVSEVLRSYEGVAAA
jgi:hypothetical protein